MQRAKVMVDKTKTRDWIEPGLSRRRASAWLGLTPLLPLLPLGFGGAAQAQVLSDAVLQATSVDNVLAAIGAKPERSGHLGLDMPDVVLPGRVRVRFSSAIAGTAWLVLLRGRKGQKTTPGPMPSAPANAGKAAKNSGPQPVLLSAQAFDAGASAQAEQWVDIQHSQYLTLLALSRGRWYFVEREIKVARRP